ncbi:peptidylprolyl isomerase [Actinobaculum suis]|uniref:FKBP-type peptidyl-prolyl cis-trans isomerase n=1 Tax=Actinobaculum suis TaxID=1657 RepID=UPI00066FCB0D|nr:FKBP-type peptidyl-prolyl cis-trans isomerase [Actinobaculum suis]KMY23871.1 peptidylprolyl isomerase [Actinobaculum suis]
MAESAMPQVSGGFGDRPDFEWPEGEAPQGLVVKTLVEGDGPMVRAGSQIECDYHGVIWGGKLFDSSYDRGTPATFGIGVGQVIARWDRGIVGKNVGSRLLLAIPPALGYGRRGIPQAGIGGDDVLVFVVDIRKQF